MAAIAPTGTLVVASPSSPIDARPPTPEEKTERGYRCRPVEKRDTPRESVLGNEELCAIVYSFLSKQEQARSLSSVNRSFYAQFDDALRRDVQIAQPLCTDHPDKVRDDHIISLLYRATFAGIDPKFDKEGDDKGRLDLSRFPHITPAVVRCLGKGPCSAPPIMLPFLKQGEPRPADQRDQLRALKLKTDSLLKDPLDAVPLSTLIDLNVNFRLLQHLGSDNFYLGGLFPASMEMIGRGVRPWMLFKFKYPFIISDLEKLEAECRANSKRRKIAYSRVMTAVYSQGGDRRLQYLEAELFATMQNQGKGITVSADPRATPHQNRTYFLFQLSQEEQLDILQRTKITLLLDDLWIALRILRQDPTLTGPVNKILTEIERLHPHFGSQLRFELDNASDFLEKFRIIRIQSDKLRQNVVVAKQVKSRLIVVGCIALAAYFIIRIILVNRSPTLPSNPGL